MRVSLALGLILLVVAARPVEGPDETTERVIAADTLRFTITAGHPLVVPLPGPEEATFRGVRLPSLSWLVDRSFGWRTVYGQEGREYVVIQRREGARVDTLVLVVDVE